MVIEDSRPMLCSIVEYLSKDIEINIVDTAIEGVEALQKLKTVKPDIALLDLMLPGKDGFAILEELSELGMIKNPTHFIVLTAMESAALTKMLFKLGVDYVMIKPYDISDLLKRIKNINLNENAIYSFDSTMDKKQELERKVCSVLSEIGIMANLKGYKYIKSAVLLGYDDEDILGAITKSLYPAISEEYNTSPTRVERAIRHAIELAWKNEDAVLAYEAMGFSNLGSEKRPTNSEFIHAVIEYLKMVL